VPVKFVVNYMCTIQNTPQNEKQQTCKVAV